MTNAPAFKIALDLDEAAAATGLSKESLRRAIHSAALKAKRSGRSTKAGTEGDGTGKYLIKVVDLEAYIDGLVDA